MESNIIAYDNRKTIIIYGLSNEEKAIIENVKLKDHNIFYAKDIVDMMAIPCFMIILNPCVLSDEDKEEFIEYYSDIIDMVNEKIIITEKMDIPGLLHNKIEFKVNFFDDQEKVKFEILAAAKKRRKDFDYSRRLSDLIKVLKIIKKEPKITTKRIAEKIEVSQRTVQRYISTLRASGEPIECDKTTNGYYLDLGMGISILED